MGFLSSLKDDVSRSINIDRMKAKGIYSTSDYTNSCAFCQYWDRSSEVCTYHQLRFDGEDKRCNKFSHK